MQRTQSNSTGAARASARAAIAAAAMLMMASPAIRAQGLEHTMRKPWSLYVFVATSLPHSTLVSLAREAAVTRAKLVFRGFANGAFDIGGEQRLVAQLNEECCHVEPDAPLTQSRSSQGQLTAPAWSIDPMLYTQFNVDQVPAFVLSANGATGDKSYSKVTGDMAIATALKFFAQRSSVGSIKTQAAAIYQASFGGRE